jgi:X-X-X-Leu-X-X-Gly heptad repeat protein
MKKTTWLVALAFAAACGGGRPGSGQTLQQATDAGQQAADTTKAGASTVQKGAEQMAQGLQQMASGLQQMAKNAVKPVAYEELEALLPELDGWQRSNPKGEMMTVPFAASRASATYEQGDTRIELEITDSAMSQFALAPLATFLAVGFDERSDDGYRKSTKIAGSPAFEDWDQHARHAEVTVVVASRFIVKGTGSSVNSVAPVRHAVEQVDLAKLAGVK